MIIDLLNGTAAVRDTLAARASLSDHEAALLSHDAPRSSQKNQALLACGDSLPVAQALQEVQMDSPLMVGINDAARALGLGRTTTYVLINEGKIETVKIGRRTLVKMESIRRLVNNA